MIYYRRHCCTCRWWNHHDYEFLRKSPPVRDFVWWDEESPCQHNPPDDEAVAPHSMGYWKCSHYRRSWPMMFKRRLPKVVKP